MLEQYFSELGFNVRDAKVYMALAELGKGTAQAVAKKCDLPRTSVYGFLEGLVTKGLISKEVTRSTTIYLLNSPSSFIRLVEEEKENLKKKEEIAKTIANLVEPYIKGTHFNLPKLQYFEGKRNVENALYRYLPEWRKSYKKLNNYSMWGFQDHTFVDEYRRWHDYAWSTRDENEVIQLFSTPEGVKQQSKEKIRNREIRALPIGVVFPCSIWVHGEFVIFAVTRSKPHYLVLMADSVFSRTLQIIFELLWQIVPAK